MRKGSDPGGEVLIEFDGRQLVASSDDPEAINYLRRKYAHMLASKETERVGKLSVRRTSEGYVVNGTVELEHPAPLDALFDWLCHDIFLQFVGSRPDLFWMHAGAVEKNGNSIVIAGKSGQGKSTLVTQLFQRGWNVLSDEYAPIRLDANEVLPYPRTPRRRVFPGRELEQREFASFELEEIAIPDHAVRRTPAKLHTLIFPQFQIGATPRLDRLSRGDAAMETFRNSTNFVDHKGSGVQWIAGMVTEIPAYRLTYEIGADAAELVIAELGEMHASVSR